MFTLKFRQLFMAVCLGLWAASAVADPATSSSSLTSLLGNVKSMTAEFTQTVFDGKGAVLQKSTGQMALQRPGRFRWSIKTPSPQLLVTDGNTLWIYDIALEQATEQPLENKTQVSPAQLLSGSVDELAKSFKIQALPAKKGQRFKLIPLAETNLFQWVMLTFVGDTLTEMRLLDGLDQETRLNFTNERLNPPLKSSLFQFHPPAGVDVIRQKAA